VRARLWAMKGKAQFGTAWSVQDGMLLRAVLLAVQGSLLVMTMSYHGGATVLLVIMIS
jgi:hypothetical protein